MSITLNGIAQGYITDKAGELLKSRGFTNVLVNMGEQLALGPKSDGRPWSIGLASPSMPDAIVTELPLSSGAVATSGGYGYLFDAAGRFPHILDPRTGRAAASWASISVVSDRATLADGLSTALMVLPGSQARTILGSNRAYAVAMHGNGGHWLD
jgi:thiamine biosynthesis lipoprotein